MICKKFFLFFAPVIISLAVLAGCSSAGASENNSSVLQVQQGLSHQPSGVPSPVDPNSLANMATMLDVVEHSVLEVNVTITATSTFGSSTTSQAAGSAWVLDSNGTLITCQHVIEGATQITVTNIEGTTFPAQLVNADPVADIAVLKVNTGTLPALKVGDTSQLRVGTWVVAVGNPLGEGISAKQGIISRLGVKIPFSDTQTYNNMIEISAAINPGNSGGPLVNLNGEVVGVTTIKVSEVGVEGMGYATNMVDNVPVIQRLMAQ